MNDKNIVEELGDRISKFKSIIIAETIKNLNISNIQKKEIIKEMLEKIKNGELKV
jgi:predicted DNA-binding protein